MGEAMMAGDAIGGRDIHIDHCLNILIQQKDIADKLKVIDEMTTPPWLWADYHEIKSGDYRYSFYTKSFKLTMALSRREDFFTIMSIVPKKPRDRLRAVRLSARVWHGRRINVVESFRDIDSAYETGALARQIIDITDNLRQRRQDWHNDSVQKWEVKQQFEEWAENTIRLIEFQKDYEYQNQTGSNLRYKGFEPIPIVKIRGVAYRFILETDFTIGSNDYINKYVVIASSPKPQPEEYELTGKVIEAEPCYLIVSFAHTIDFGRFPNSGYLFQSDVNIAYQIQVNTIKSLCGGESVNKSILKILVDEQLSPFHPPLPEHISGFCLSQQQAISSAIAVSDLLLIQGPPGTGKTTIIVEMIRRFVKQGLRVLISSKNNLAVDNVLEKCIDEKISCIRLGTEEKVKIEKVKRRLLDRAAVELQGDIVKNCSHELLAAYDEFNNAQTYFKVMQELREPILGWVELQLKLKLCEKEILDTETRTHSANRFFRIVTIIETYWYRLIRNDEKETLAQRKYKDRIAMELANNTTYQTYRETAAGIADQMSVVANGIDSVLNEHSVSFSYKEKARIEIEQFYEKEQQRISQLQEKAAIIRRWKEALSERRTSLYPLLLRSVKVVGATCVGVDTAKDYHDVDFDVVILDEAGQITEFDALIPMARARKVILIGDHKQLPPVFDENMVKEFLEYAVADLDSAEQEKISEQIRARFGTSLFERLFAICPPENRVMLDEQFRMHPVIAEFISREFYDHKYRSGISSNDREIDKNFPFQPLTFLDTASIEQYRFEQTPVEQEQSGYFNHAEAQLLVRIVIHLLEQNYTCQQIGVITPYKLQKDYIKEMFQKHTAESENVKKCDCLEIDTVDSFQGRDKDIILFSFTRSNPEGKIGFLKELRRLNVTMTRAKYCLIMIGDSTTICAANDRNARQCFNNLIRYIKNQGLYETDLQLDDRNVIY